MSPTHITTILWILFIVVLPWQTVYIVRDIFIDGEKWQYGTIGIHASTLALLAVSSWLLVRKLWVAKQTPSKPAHQKETTNAAQKKPTRRRTQLLVLTCMAFLGWTLLSATWASDPTLALAKGLFLTLFLSLFLSVPQMPKQIWLLAAVFLIGGTLQGALGLGQFSVQADFSSTVLGVSAHDPLVGGTSVVEADGIRWLRAYGGMPHPNILGGFLAVALLVATSALLWVQQKRWWQTALLYGSIAFMGAGLIATFSRAAWLALGCAGTFLVAATWYWQSTHRSVLLRKTLALVALGAIVGGLFVVLVPQLFQTRVQTETRLEQKSLSDRAAYVLQAQALTDAHPVRGVGAGNYTLAVRAAESAAEPIWVYQPVHHLLRLVWAELGIVGLLLFVSIIGIVLWRAVCRLWQASTHGWQQHHTITLTSLAVLTALLITSLFDHWLWTAHTGHLLFWLTLALLWHGGND